MDKASRIADWSIQIPKSLVEEFTTRTALIPTVNIRQEMILGVSRTIAYGDSEIIVAMMAEVAEDVLL